MWSLGTPKEKTMSSVWASFKSGTPGLRPENSDATRTSSYQTSNESYFDSQPGSSVNLATSNLPVEATAQPLAVNAPRDPATSTIPPPPVEIAEENDEDASDEGNETSSSHDNSSMNHASPRQMSPTTLPDSSTTSTMRPENTTRPSMYHQLSQSMINFGSTTDDQGAASAGVGADKASVRPQLETIRSREGAPTKIEIPKSAQIGPGAAPFTPGAEWAKPPPTPAAGFAGMFWNRKEGDKPALKRRRSAGDTEGAPPGYEPPHPGVVIPRPRDEEGREKLPEYWCAVSLIPMSILSLNRAIVWMVTHHSSRFTLKERYLERWSSRHQVSNPEIEVGRNTTTFSEEPHCLYTSSTLIDSRSRPIMRSYPLRTRMNGNRTSTSTCPGRGDFPTPPSSLRTQLRPDDLHWIVPPPDHPLASAQQVVDEGPSLVL